LDSAIGAGSYAIQQRPTLIGLRRAGLNRLGIGRIPLEIESRNVLAGYRPLLHPKGKKRSTFQKSRWMHTGEFTVAKEPIQYQRRTG
jgi:hypothetical protein